MSGLKLFTGSVSANSYSQAFEGYFFYFNHILILFYIFCSSFYYKTLNILKTVFKTDANDFSFYQSVVVIAPKYYA